MNDLESRQRDLAHRFGASFAVCPHDSKLGIASGVAAGLWPLHGLRHPVTGSTNGWYLWAGEELSEDPDFFAPMHMWHLEAIRPEIIPYLGLAPGWRFLIAPDYEDVWYDRTLLIVDDSEPEA